MSWPLKYKQEYDRIQKLAGHRKTSKLFRDLALQWLESQETTLQNNPIGLRYSTPDSKHWMDTITQIDIDKITEDLELCEDQETLGKIFSIAKAIQETANKRTLAVWKNKKTVMFKG